jgi:hypothetical protein
VVVHGIAVFESSNISRSGCASTAIITETMTTERSWPKASQYAGCRARRLQRGRVDSEEDMLVCDGERTGTKRVAHGMHDGHGDAILQVSGSGTQEWLQVRQQKLP